MKKLTLVTVLAVLMAGPAFANHGDMNNMSNDHVMSSGSDYAVGTPMHHGSGMWETRTVTTASHPMNEESKAMDYTGTYALLNGDHLAIEGRSAYLVDSNGRRFFAPNNGYVTDRGMTFYTEDGQVLRMENPPEVVSLDSNHHTY